MTTTENKVIEIDATGRRLGKLATEVATILMGKNEPDYVAHLVAPVTVRITNISKLDIPEGKKTAIYQSYSGYPGGRTEETLEHLAKRRGYSEVFLRTVKGMLPKNKLQKQMLLNIEISE